MLGLVFLGIGVGVPVYLLSGFRGNNVRVPPASPPDSSLPPPRVSRIQLDPVLSDVRTGFGSVWAAELDAVRRINPNTGAVSATISLADNSDRSQLAVGEGAVWVTTGAGDVARIDPSTNQVAATIAVGQTLVGITVGGGSVWVIRVDSAGGSLAAIDPGTNQMVGEQVLLPGDGPGPVSYIDGVLWVTNTSSGGSITRIGASTLVEIPTATQVGSGVQGPVSELDASVWAVVEGAAVQLDKTTGSKIGSVRVDRASDLAVGDGRLWVLTQAGSLSADVYEPDPDDPEQVLEIDPATGDTVEGSTATLGFNPAQLAVGAGGVWVGDFESGVLWKVVPGTVDGP